MKKKPIRERAKAVEFRINGEIKDLPKCLDGILETRDSDLIAKLRALPDDQALEVFKERAS